MKRSSRKSTPLLTNKQTYFIFPFSIFAPVLCVLYFQSIHFLQSLAHTHTHTHNTKWVSKKNVGVYEHVYRIRLLIFSCCVCVLIFRPLLRLCIAVVVMLITSPLFIVISINRTIYHSIELNKIISMLFQSIHSSILNSP